MSSTGSLSVSTILSTITKDFNASEGSIVAGVTSWFGPRLLELGLTEIELIGTSIKHFIGNLKAGMSWGAAMASLLTEVWNGTKSALADFATEVVEAIGNVFQSVGLIPA